MYMDVTVSVCDSMSLCVRVGINVLKNYWRPRVTILQCGLCCPARRLGDTAIPGAGQAACLGQDQRGAVTADHGRGSSALPLSTCPGEWSLPLCPWGLGLLLPDI